MARLLLLSMLAACSAEEPTRALLLPDQPERLVVSSNYTEYTPSSIGYVTAGAFGINDAGTLVGTGVLPDGSGTEPITWSSYAVKPAPLPTLAGRPYGVANDINTKGDIIVGSLFGPSGAARLPVKWTRRKPAALPLLAGFTEGYALAVNDKGAVLGVVARYTTQYEQVAVVWSSNGKPTALDTTGLTGVNVRDISNTGDVVGSARELNSFEIRAVRWRGAGYSFLPSPQDGFVATANAINAAGAIAGGSYRADLTNLLPTIWPASAPPEAIDQLSVGTATAISSRNRIAGTYNSLPFTSRGVKSPELLPTRATVVNSFLYAVNRCGTIVGEIDDGGNGYYAIWEPTVCDP